LENQEPHGGLSRQEWLARFQDSAEEKVRNQLASEEDRGAVHKLVLEHREDGVWAIATFTMDVAPAATFIRSQRVMPDLSSEWDPEFAAMLFETHLIEWFHVDAKRRAPDSSGTVRN
jgi:hypothetical protein